MREQVEAVQRMQDYIAEHLYETLTQADLARAAHYSPWYAYRLFYQWLKRTPADYVRRLRLSRSALMLRDDHSRVADAAFAVGFNSVDGYQRAFQREFGCNPGEYATSPVPLYLFTPYRIQDAAAIKEKPMENVRTVFVQVVEKPARKAILKRGRKAEDYYAYCEEVGCDVWGLLLSLKPTLGEPVGYWLPNEMAPAGTSTYVQGVEIVPDAATSVPEGFDVVNLPTATYLAFQGEPFAEEEYEQAIEAIWDAIARYDPTTHGFAWDEHNPRIQLEPRGSRGYIELKPVVRLP